MSAKRDLNFWFDQLPAILWAAFIFILSSMPASAFPHISFPGADKLVHLGLFFILAMLTERAFRRQALIPRLQSWSVVWAVGLSLLYGSFDEIHQIFVPSRSPDLTDVAADFVGALIFAFLYEPLFAPRKRTTA